MLKNTAVRRVLAPVLLAASVTTATVAAAPPAGAAEAATTAAQPAPATPEPAVFTPELIVPTLAAKPAPAAPAQTPAQKAAAQKAAAQKAAAQKAAAQKARKAKRKAWVLPVANYTLTGRFGGSGARWASTHTGLDFAAPMGTKIRSIGAGKVIARFYDGAYGNKTVVRHTRGTVLWYCHQSSQSVRVGERVKAGEVIGRVGSTGNSTGPHLHVEVHAPRRGVVDPEVWLKQRGLGV